jgi:predicted ester cyclase
MPDTNKTDANKALVTRLVHEVLNSGQLDVIDELYASELAPAARHWITPFRESFPDAHIDIVDLISEGDKVVGRFTCSGTHLGSWLGHPPSGRRFTRIPEIYIFTIHRGKITHA